MKQHPGDVLSQDVLDWVEEMADHLAQELLGGPLAPPTAPLTEAEKLTYFAGQFFKPDGSPNPNGRDTLLAKYGPDTFATLAKALGKHHAGLHARLLTEPGGIDDGLA